MADKTVVVRLSLKSGQFTTGLSQAGNATGKFANQVAQGASRAGSSALALGAASATAGKLMILGVGGALAVSAKAAIDFESSMASVAKTTDLAGNSFDANSGPLFRFGEALRGLALRIPVNVNELAEIAALGGQLGVEVPNLIEFTEVMAAMGVATNMSATEAAKGFARFANIMRTDEGDFDRLGSIVVELGNNFATTESEILTFGTRLAPVGVVVGMTEEEVFGLSAALTSLGVPAERGGTALQRVFIAMKQAVDSGGTALSDFSEIAETTSDGFIELFKTSPAEAFAAFVKGLDNVSKRGEDVFMVLDRLNLNEQRTIQVLLATASGYETVEDAIRSAKDAGAENIALFEEARKRYGTTASQIQILGNAFNDLRLEIGNTVLGHGGLQFAITAFGEFLGIVKDNLPLIGRLAQAFVILGAIRMGANVFALFGRALDMARGLGAAATAARTMGTMARVGQVGVLLLNTAMSGAIAIGTILAGIWAFQAIKAAELKMQVRQLYDAIKEGGDPGDLLIKQMIESGALTNEMIANMQEAGVTTEELADALLTGGDALADFNYNAKPIGEVIRDIIRTHGRAGEIDVWQKVMKGVDDYLLAVRRGEPIVESLGMTIRNTLVDAALEAQAGAKLTLDELRNLADSAVQIFGRDVTETEFLKWLTGDMPMDGWQVSMSAAIDKADDDLGILDQTWMQYLRNVEGGQDIIDTFWEGSTESVQAFHEGIQEAFVEVGESVRDGFPAWDEYEQVVVHAMDGVVDAVENDLDAVIAAQDRFIQDIQAFADALPLIMSVASEDAMGFIEALGPGLQGALGRLSDAELVAFVESINAQQERINEVHRQTWLVKLPQNVQAGMAEMVGLLMEEVVPIAAAGGNAAEAFGDRLIMEFAQIPALYQTEVMGYLTDLLESEGLADALGAGVTQDWIDGILRILKTMASQVNPELNRQFDNIKGNAGQEYEATSPSRWWKRFGEDWMAGLAQGIVSGKAMYGIDKLLNPGVLLKPTISTGNPGTVVTNNRSNSQTINLNFTPQAKGTVAETQTALTLLHLVGGVERGDGRIN